MFSLKEVKKLTSQEILNDFADILTYPADILYCGKKGLDEIASLLQGYLLPKQPNFYFSCLVVLW
jgi:hypothetical protein